MLYLENSGCFLMTSLRVASTAAMVSSEVPTSRCGLPLGSFCTRSRIAYFPTTHTSPLAFLVFFSLTVQFSKLGNKLHYCNSDIRSMFIVQYNNIYVAINFSHTGFVYNFAKMVVQPFVKKTIKTNNIKTYVIKIIILNFFFATRCLHENAGIRYVKNGLIAKI